MTPTVLLVQPASRCRHALAEELGRAGFHVVTANTSTEAVELARTEPLGGIDIIVTEVPLGAVSGQRLLQRLRAANGLVPVVVISAHDGENDQANGLNQGAEAYLVTPLYPLVLIAHIRVVLRRPRAAERIDTATRTLQIGTSVLTLSCGQLSLVGHSVGLTGRESMLLTALADPPGQVFSRDDLLRSAWPDADPAVSINSVEVYVGYLRRKLTHIGAAHLAHRVRAWLPALRDHPNATGTDRRASAPPPGNRHTESSRRVRRLHLLEGWGHGKVIGKLPGRAAGAGRVDGARGSGGLPLGVGGDTGGGQEVGDWVGGNAAEMVTPGRYRFGCAGGYDNPGIGGDTKVAGGKPRVTPGE